MSSNRQKLREVLDFEEMASSIIQSCNPLDAVDEVLAAVKMKINLGKDLTYAQYLAIYIILSMQSNSSENMARHVHEFLRLITESIESNGDDVKTLAKDFARQRKFLKAVLLFLVAAAFYGNSADGISALNGITKCFKGTQIAVGELIESRSELSCLIARHILSLFDVFRRIIQEVQNIDQVGKVICDAQCVDAIAYTQYRLGDYKGAESTCKLGLDMIETVSSADVESL